jgi:hypothetical protein
MSNLTVTKLSKLQRFILKAAVCNLWNAKSFSASVSDVALASSIGFKISGNFTHLYKYEIMEGFFGFDPFLNPERNMYFATRGEFRHLRRPGSQLFKPDWIGKEKYQSAHASISRAINRLDSRGFVTQWRGAYWSGIELTESGIKIAEHLAFPQV